MASDKEKASIEAQRSEITDEKLNVPVYAAEVDTHEVDEAKLIRKIDWALIPWCVQRLTGLLSGWLANDVVSAGSRFYTC